MDLPDMTQISLGLQCVDYSCNPWASKLYNQLASGGYGVCSVLQMPASIQGWRDAHRTARKRSDRCERLGYTFAPVSRHDHVDDIYEINTSLDQRQGREMSEGYHKRPSASPDPSYPCVLHGVHPYGVFSEHDNLVAYLWIYRSKELALVSQILGHGDHLANDVMYLLWTGMLEQELRLGGAVVYNRHDSGSDGLRYYKERVGLRAEPVVWLP